jgi:hypothetical protein
MPLATSRTTISDSARAALVRTSVVTGIGTPPRGGAHERERGTLSEESQDRYPVNDSRLWR